MSFIVAINHDNSQLPERQPTGTLIARAPPNFGHKPK